MTLEQFLALIGLAVATLFTPGPNNAMLAASGATFGLRRTLPHAMGVSAGFPAMMLIVGLALGGLFQSSALLRETLRWGGALILLWMAWKIANSGGISGRDGAVRPMRFLEAVAFQWVNPKAWTMAVAATTQFVTVDAPIATALTVAVTFMGLGVMSSTLWIGAGQSFSRWLTTPARLRAFNVTMALLIVLSTAQMLFQPHSPS